MAVMAPIHVLLVIFMVTASHFIALCPGSDVASSGPPEPSAGLEAISPMPSAETSAPFSEEMSRNVLFEELLEIDPPAAGPHREQDYRVPSEFMRHMYEDIADLETGELRPSSSHQFYSSRTAQRQGGASVPMLREDIYSFASNDVTLYSESIPRDNRVDELTGWRLSFNLEQFRSKNRYRKVQYAELAVYGRHCYSDATKQRKIAARRTAVETFTQLQLGENKTLHWVPVVHKQHIRLKECWQRFNVTLAVNKWQEHRRPGHSEILLVTSQREKRGNMSEDFGLEDLLEVQDQKTGKHVVLVIYSGKPVELQEKATRSKRSVPTKPNGRRRKTPMPLRDRSYTLCARRSLKVDVRHLGMDLVAPRTGIKAYRCAGSCSYPISHVKKTNHAVMEAMFGQADPQYHIPGLAAGPCCIPTQYSSRSLLISIQNGVNILKVINKLVAERCGCQ